MTIITFYYTCVCGGGKNEKELMRFCLIWHTEKKKWSGAAHSKQAWGKL